MRIGDNPNKNNSNAAKHIHQVIIPVYIPDEAGYFSDAFEILKLCIVSLINTSHPDTYITIVNNGSSEKVRTYLNSLLDDKKISEVIHTSNVGKINAVLKGLSGINADLLTVSDQDILFQENWQSETVRVFNDFPNAGVVGIVPMFNAYVNYSHNIITDYLFSKKLKFRDVKNPDAMMRFYDSIWTTRDYNKNYLKSILTLSSEKNNSIAIVGSGHLVATYRKSIFNSFEKTFTDDLLSSDSDRIFLDLPPLNKGYYRLTTYDNYACHMGNKYEKWMDELFPNKNQSFENQLEKIQNTGLIKKGIFLKTANFIKSVFIRKIVFSKLVYKYFLAYKGLNKNFVKGF